MLQFHPNNLGHRQRCELAYFNRLGVDLTVMNTVAEVLCHTESVPEDLLFSERSRRLWTLIKGGYAETCDGSVPHTSAQIRQDGRFRLTEKGRQVLESAVAKPFSTVGETISSTLHEDHGVIPEHRKAFQQILDAETADRRVHQSYGQSRSKIRGVVDQKREQFEKLLSDES